MEPLLVYNKTFPYKTVCLFWCQNLCAFSNCGHEMISVTYPQIYRYGNVVIFMNFRRQHISTTSYAAIIYPLTCGRLVSNFELTHRSLGKRTLEMLSLNLFVTDGENINIEIHWDVFMGILLVITETNGNRDLRLCMDSQCIKNSYRNMNE